MLTKLCIVDGCCKNKLYIYLFTYLFIYSSEKPQNTEILTTAASFPTDDLLRVLTTHPTYQRVLTEYLEPGKVVGHQLTNRQTMNGNNNLREGSISPQSYKKYD